MNLISSIPKSNSYRPEIDGLRAFAVIAVIINHINSSILRSGYLGVDIFFVISGFVITSSLLRRESSNFFEFISDFYSRRIKRLIPTLVVFVLITSILISLFNPSSEIPIRTGISSLFGVSNIWLYIEADSYFANSSLYDPFTHTWSLSLEEQFYFIFPFLFWFSGLGRENFSSKRNFIFLILTISIISVLIFCYLYPINQSAAYYLLPSRFWEMAFGALTFISIEKENKINLLIKKVPPEILIFGILAVMFLPNKFAVQTTLLTVIFTGLFLISVNNNSIIYRFLTTSMVLFIGKISYSLYLWHWAIICLGRWTIGLQWYTIPIHLLLMFFISCLSFLFIENPIRKAKVFKKSYIFISAIFTIIFSQLLLFFIGISGKRYLYTGNLNGIYRRNIKSKTILFNGCNLSRSDFEKIILKNECNNINALNEQKKIIIVGDSHSDMFANSINTLFKEKYKIVRSWGNGCLFPPDGIIDANSDSYRCDKEHTKTFNWIEKNLNENDVIFLAGKYIKSLFDNKYSGQKIGSRDFEDYFSDLKNFLTFTSSINAKVFLLVGGPIFDEVSDPYCANEWFRPKFVIPEKCFKERELFEKKRNQYINYLVSNFKDYKIVLIEDYLQLICNNKSCDAGRYFDSDHYLDDLTYEILKINNLEN